MDADNADWAETLEECCCHCCCCAVDVLQPFAATLVDVIADDVEDDGQTRLNACWVPSMADGRVVDRASALFVALVPVGRCFAYSTSPANASAVAFRRIPLPRRRGDLYHFVL